MASLLAKFRIDFSDVTVIPDVTKKAMDKTKQEFQVRPVRRSSRIVTFFNLISVGNPPKERDHGAGLGIAQPEGEDQQAPETGRVT